jgi:hypothetical protein
MELKHTYSFTGHSANVKAVISLLDGRVASAGFDTTVRIWNPRTWRQDTSIPLNTTPFCLALLEDGSLVVGCGDHAVYVLAIDGVRVTRKHVMTGHDAPVFSVCTFRDEAGRELVASGSRDKTIRLWDPRKGESVGAVLTGHEDTVGGLMSLSEGLLVSCSTDTTIRVWDLATMASVLTLRGHARSVVALSGLSWGGGGARIASGSEDGTIRIWDLMTGVCESILDGRDPSAPPGTHVTVWALTLLPNDFLVSGGDDGVLRVWDVSAGGCVASQRSKDGPIHCLDLLPRPRAAAALVPAPTAAAATASSAAPATFSSTAAATPAAPAVPSASAAADGTGTLVTANFAEFSVGLFRVPAAAMIPHLSSAPRVRLNRRSLLGSGGRRLSRGESGSLSHDDSGSSIIGGASRSNSSSSSSGSLMSALRSEASTSLFGSLTAPAAAAAHPSDSGSSGAGGGKKPLRHGDIPTAVSGGAVSSRRFRTSTTEAGDGGMGGDYSRDDSGDGTAARCKRASQLGAGGGAAAAGPGGVRVADSAERDVVFSFDDPGAEGAATAASASEPEPAGTGAAGGASVGGASDAGNTSRSAAASGAAAAGGIAAGESDPLTGLGLGTHSTSTAAASAAPAVTQDRASGVAAGSAAPEGAAVAPVATAAGAATVPGAPAGATQQVPRSSGVAEDWERRLAAGRVYDEAAFEALLATLRDTRAELATAREGERAATARVQELVGVVAGMQATITTQETRIQQLVRLATPRAGQ